MGATDDRDLTGSLGEAGGSTGVNMAGGSEGPTLSQSSPEKGERKALSLETQSQERDGFQNLESLSCS